MTYSHERYTKLVEETVGKIKELGLLNGLALFVLNGLCAATITDLALRTMNFQIKERGLGEPLN